MPTVFQSSRTAFFFLSDIYLGLLVPVTGRFKNEHSSPVGSVFLYTFEVTGESQDII